MRSWSTTSHPHRSARRIAPALLLSLSLALGSTVSGAQPRTGADAQAKAHAGAKASAQVAADPSVITTWNAHAVATLGGPAPAGAAKTPPQIFVYLSFVHLAMYNAVNGITGEFELYRWHGKPDNGASPEAAAAAAAHRILDEYFGALGTIGADLDTKLAASLALIPDGTAKDRGVEYGVRAANRIIELRENDGRDGVVVVPLPMGPGDWEPTPPTLTPFNSPWFGGIDPLAVDDVSDFDPGAPPQIGTKRYLREFREVRDYGVATGSLRTPGMEQTALFFADTPVGPMQAALRRLAMERGLDISEAARMFAAVEVSTSDALQAVWYGKLKYMWWRPITAIRKADTDGDPRTAAVPDWNSFIPTPPYPDWPSGLCAVIGATLVVAKRANDGELDLHIVSPSQGERHYTDPRAFKQDAVNARVWSGIHFRTADRVSIHIGRNVAREVMENFFQRAD